MEFVQGRPITPEIKKLIVTVKHYFDRNKSEISKTDSSVQLTADAFAIGVVTVKRVMADYNRDPELLEKPPNYRGRPGFAVSASNEEKVRYYIRQANQNGQYISLNSIRDFLQEGSSGETFHISTLSRTLDRWGFTFGKGTRTQRFKEKDHVIAARRRYLRKKRNNRVRKDSDETIKPEVYLDESYVNKNHSNDFIWYSGDDFPLVQKPTGKGERLIIINAITKDGWVPGAKLVFKSNRRTGDYHGQMNWDMFLKWFTEKLMPNIPKNSLIIMDNAAYHNILSKYSAPTPACSKAKILGWLEQNKVFCEKDCLKSELIELLEKLAPEPTYAIDEIARDNGHEILRTPPYHPELQPIETCWGIVKNHVARNCDFTMKNLIEQLDNGFEKVSGQTCTKIIAKVREIEDQFWDEDSRLDEE